MIIDKDNMDDCAINEQFPVLKNNKLFSFDLLSHCPWTILFKMAKVAKAPDIVRSLSRAQAEWGTLCGSLLLNVKIICSKL